jgi:hypothetical protein
MAQPRAVSTLYATFSGSALWCRHILQTLSKRVENSNRFLGHQITSVSPASPVKQHRSVDGSRLFRKVGDIGSRECLRPREDVEMEVVPLLAELCDVHADRPDDRVDRAHDSTEKRPEGRRRLVRKRSHVAGGSR